MSRLRWWRGQAAGPELVLEESRSSGSGFSAVSCSLTLDLDHRCPNEGNEKWQKEIQERLSFFFFLMIRVRPFPPGKVLEATLSHSSALGHFRGPFKPSAGPSF